MATKAKDEVKEQLDAGLAQAQRVAALWKKHPRAESHFVVGATRSDGFEVDLAVDAVGDKVAVSLDGKVIYLDKTQTIRLQKHLQEAFQVVA